MWSSGSICRGQRDASFVLGGARDSTIYRVEDISQQGGDSFILLLVGQV